MKLFGRELQGFAKTLVILSGVLLVSAGLCGLQSTVYDKSPSAVQGLFMATGALELCAFCISAFGIVIVPLLWAQAALLARFSNTSKDEAQKLLDERDESKHDSDR